MSSATSASDTSTTTTTNNFFTSKGGSLTPQEFNTILLRECQSELSHLPSSDDANHIWMDSTTKIWQTTTTTNSASKEATSFIICESTPNLSGNKRKKLIKPLFISAASEDDDKDATTQAFLDHTTTIYNGNDKSCVLITCFISVAQAVLLASSSSSPETTTTMKIQPLLPMAKITAGTMNTIQRRVSTKRNLELIRIKAVMDRNLASLSNDHQNQEEEESLAETIWKEIQMESSSDKKNHVLDTFPSSGLLLVTSHQEEEVCTDVDETNRRLLSSEDNDSDTNKKCNIFNQVIMTNTLPNQDEDYDVEDPIMYVDIYLHPNSDKQIIHTKDVKVWDVVSMVSALACRLEILTVELEEEIVLLH